jgi:hypothetical protein
MDISFDKALLNLQIWSSDRRTVSDKDIQEAFDLVWRESTKSASGVAPALLLITELNRRSARQTAFWGRVLTYLALAISVLSLIFR